MSEHQDLISLIIAYTLTGAFVFTVAATCFSLLGWITFAERAQQQKLFYTLIVELVVIGLGTFGGLLEFNPTNAQEKIAERAIREHEAFRITVPSNYKSYVSKSSGIGFGYPDSYDMAVYNKSRLHGSIRLHDFLTRDFNLDDEDWLYESILIRTNDYTDSQMADFREMADRAENMSLLMAIVISGIPTDLPFQTEQLSSSDFQFEEMIVYGEPAVLVTYNALGKDGRYTVQLAAHDTKSGKFHFMIMGSREQDLERAKSLMKSIASTVAFKR